MSLSQNVTSNTTAYATAELPDNARIQLSAGPAVKSTRAS